MPSIRRAEKRDQARVGDLWVAFLNGQAAQDTRFQVADDVRERFENDFPVWIGDETQRTLVAEDEDGTIVGFATAHRWGPPPIQSDASEVFVDELYVVPGARRQGTGRRLAGALRDWADELEADRLRLRVLHANEAGHAFWKHVGAGAYGVTMTLELEREARPGGGSSDSQRIGF